MVPEPDSLNPEIPDNKKPADKEPVNVRIQSYYMKFKHTPPDSFIGYLMLLYKELKERYMAAVDPNEKFWYLDASELVLEVLNRYDELRLEKELREYGTFLDRPRYSSDR